MRDRRGDAHIVDHGVTTVGHDDVVPHMVGPHQLAVLVLQDDGLAIASPVDLVVPQAQGDGDQVAKQGDDDRDNERGVLHRTSPS